MEIVCHDGIKRKVYLERIEERLGEQVMRSSILEPTEKEVSLFKNKECSHINCVEQLIYDENQLWWDHRKCAICGQGLGEV